MYPALRAPCSERPVAVEAAAILRILFDGCAPGERWIEALLDRIEARP